MKIKFLLKEITKKSKIIVVDVQPSYSYYDSKNGTNILPKTINFVNSQSGPVLMLVNAEKTRMSKDTIESIKQYWEQKAENGSVDWSRFEIIDKGFGYLRAWMDKGVDEKIIIKTIRELYKQKKYSTEDLNRDSLDTEILHIMQEISPYNPINIDWVSLSKLKQFDGAYIVGGGRNECLREVELMMNAFNIKYTRIDKFVYG